MRELNTIETAQASGGNWNAVDLATVLGCAAGWSGGPVNTIPAFDVVGFDLGAFGQRIVNSVVVGATSRAVANVMNGYVNGAVDSVTA